MNRKLYFVFALSLFLVSSSEASFSFGMKGAVKRQVGDVDDKVQEKNLAQEEAARTLQELERVKKELDDLEKERAEGDARPEDVREGRTFSREGDVGLTGTMPDKGEFDFTPGALGTTSAAGYYSSVEVQGDAGLIPDNIKEGKTIFGVEGVFSGTHTYVVFLASGALTVTGATVSYRSGDDGDLQEGLDFNFSTHTIEGDDVVIDHNTGLMWARDGAGDGCLGGGTATWDDAIDWAESLDFAGYTDWRIPNIRELLSIINYGETDPCIDSYYFPNTYVTVAGYWTSTTTATEGGEDRAYHVSFFNGYVQYGLKTSSYRVRAVRGGPAYE